MPFLRPRRSPTLSGEAEGSTAALSDPDQAWKALSLVNEWIRHADAKAGATLAFVGVTAGILLGVVADVTTWHWFTTLAAAACGFALLCAGLFGGASLLPRLGRRVPWLKTHSSEASEDEPNLLFFADIRRTFGGDRKGYRAAFGSLTTDRQHLAGAVTDQVHANALIADSKFRWVDRAITSQLVAVVALVVLIVLVRLVG